MAQEDFVFGIVPCVICGHMTRSGRAKARDAPGTRARVGGGLCRECGKKPVERVTYHGPTAEAIRARDAYTLATLNRFIDARNARIEKARKLARL